MAQLHRLSANCWCDPGTETDQQSEKGEHDDSGANASRYAPTRKTIDTTGDGETEQDAHERRQKEAIREPEEPEGDVHRHHERRSTQDVLTLPSHSATTALANRQRRGYGGCALQRVVFLSSWISHR